MYCEVRGQGEPLLMSMGLGGHSLDWGWIVPQRLADRYKVILFGNRGAGSSDQPWPCTIKQMAEDTTGLMNTLEIDHTHVFGGSMGGMIALQMALDHPERVDKLVLGATTAGGRSRIFPPPCTLVFYMAQLRPSLIPPPTASRLPRIFRAHKSERLRGGAYILDQPILRKLWR